MARPRLITIRASHYCEKARWALERCGVAYDEECHVPAWQRLSVRKYGGNTVPVLVTDDGVFTDSTDILQHLERLHPGRLYPTDPELRREVDELEELFDEVLGPHIRRRAYGLMLPHRQLLLNFSLQKVRTRERLLFTALLPLLKVLLRKALNITPESIQRSEAKIEGVLEQVEARLADGRAYLVGDAFSAADLTFAALASASVLPEGYGAWLPSLDELPAEIAEDVRASRKRPGGAFVMRLYRDHRR